MNAERTIVNQWLNSKGYFTINNFNALGNRNLGILALKHSDEKAEEIIHAEIYCSISQFSTESKTLKKVLARFSDNKISKIINSFIGTQKQDYSYKKILVASMVPAISKEALRQEFSAKGIEVLEFEAIILDVMQSLNTPYYKDDVLRALQLVKYLLLAEPVSLASLMSEKSNILNVSTRGIFLSELLKMELIRKEFTKADTSQIIEILKHTELRKPLKLADALENNILNKRGMNKLRAKLREGAGKNTEEKIEEKNTRLLAEYFR